MWRSSIGSSEARSRGQGPPRQGGRGPSSSAEPIAAVERLLGAGGALFRAGRFDEAARAYGEAAALAPSDIRPLSSLAVIDARCGRAASARDRLRRVVTLDPKLTHAWRNLAAICQDLGRWDEAAAAMRQTVDLAPSDVEARFGLAGALIATGRIAEGLKAYRALAAESPHRLRSLARLAIADPRTIADREAEEMAAAAKDEAVDKETRTALWFALGGVLEDRGRDDAAFDAFTAGNALKRASLERRAPGERPQDVLRAHAAAAAHVARVMIDAGDTASDGADVAPIFIVGMPRSGSSLIEQILASHRDVTGLGETGVLPRLLERAYPLRAGEPFVPALEQVRAAYLAALVERGWDGRRRFVDKTLENFLHVGAVRRMFPRAVIIESVRDPVATCVACWRQLFNRGAETLYDFEEIAAEYATYTGLMDHWRATGVGVASVALEELTPDPDRQIRRLVTELCGLPWDSGTLRFWETQGAVRTASAVQVRRPMTYSPRGGWRRYESRLGPLLETLGPHGAP
ncbi:MAG TPA: sulfotransferase [Caulobacteraceae bacterium]|nr:sulfotransferase [Caulobacteraceae bacterium]